MKVLVTGASGFIGSHLVERLLHENHSVRCLVRKTSNLTWLKNLAIPYVEGDLFDGLALKKAVEGVHYVYHSAGLTKAKTEKEFFRANVTGTTNLLNAVITHNPDIKRFLHVSSQTAAGPSPNITPISEMTSPSPITTYGRSKLKAEEECLKSASSIPITICRPPAVYGPRDKDIFEFFKTMNGGLQPMVGWNDKYVSLIHAKDLVRGFVLAAQSPSAAGQVYFITSKEIYDWKRIGEVTRAILKKRALRLRIPPAGVYVIAAFAEAMAAFSAKPALINFEKARDMVQDYWTCDGSKAKRDFGFEQEISLEEGIRETVEWYRNEGWM